MGWRIDDEGNASDMRATRKQVKIEHIYNLNIGGGRPSIHPFSILSINPIPSISQTMIIKLMMR